MTIEIQDLAYTHPGGTTGLHVPQLTVQAGETLAVIGPSGSGKTTFLNVLSGLLRPDNGSIRVNGIAVDALSRRAAQVYRADSVGYVFQDFGLLDYLTARDNILHPFRIARGRRVTPHARNRANELAKALGIADRLTHRPAQLSHGEKQRVAICRAVVTDPKVLLADEPTGNLDPDTAALIMDHLLTARDRLGATLVMVTHDHSLLDRFDRVLDFRDLWRSGA
ncbi:ABC transporter ATP-binding protein [Tropicimonas sp. TH_r6]|uniref:ABC transporter ATP-binding protein n=1 Tax=Tropicimonas sp. TH_r6 TaxID=3082085 RepID=UPI002955D206|nr:ABC transporter ATP-binding protein [Tropicimonas sp. TH_r6]MDV7144291.1 ABC transporter ATP-binding protein [Tropicimonas sp. TH_r6]